MIEYYYYNYKNPLYPVKQDAKYFFFTVNCIIAIVGDTHEFYKEDNISVQIEIDCPVGKFESRIIDTCKSYVEKYYPPVVI